jgi:hypothetical protein
MNPEIFISGLRKRGFELWADGDQLHYKGTAERMDTETCAMLKELKPEILPLVSFKVNSEDPTQKLDILNPEIWKHPRPDLLIESELEAHKNWYSTMRNPSPKYGEVALSHEEATQLAWKFILDSMKNQHREGRGRYAPKSKEMKK